MTAKYIIFTLFSLVLFLSKPSFALGKLGHQVVCQLAFEHLTPIKQTKITELLKAIPQKHQDLINDYNNQKQGAPITYDNACTWADAIKRLESFRKYNSWHYMNISRKHTEIKATDCDENCLPQAILNHQQVLTQTDNYTSWQQAQALLFLGHWIGDIHQPLHISFADDLGGNKVKLSHLKSKCSNLHWYWDECILYRGKNNKVQWLDLLREKWRQSSQPNWQTEQVWQWADESFQLVTKPSFNYCQLTEQGNCQKPTDKIKLPDNYLTQYQPIMAQRLLQAAQRLSKILEKVL
ncbi:MAG: S1/P1 nuclease [Colwellia sp.]|nr:S1/P1 nuclease [Colwellia sp.]